MFPKLRRIYAFVDIIGGKVVNDLTAIILTDYVAGAYGTPAQNALTVLPLNFWKRNS